jgi:hypothetical protein
MAGFAGGGEQLSQLTHHPGLSNEVCHESIPNAYRLVTKEDGNGKLVYVLQGYFTWAEGRSRRGGEWRDLETQDWLTAQDDIPFGPLF